ncbi:MAG: hypothetical protein L0H36_02030 [bacterium]|nr:hypothetical protein [bacterium]MDN5835393.1 hypothetical protein [bacterium]
MSQNTQLNGKRRWMTPRNIFFAIGIIVLIALAVAALSINKKQADASNFVECKDAGGTVTEGTVDKCEVKDKTFEDTQGSYGESAANSEYSKQYLGMSEKDALEKAKTDKHAARVVERDGKSLIVTMDLRQGRLNFTIEDGTVTAVEEEAPNAKKNLAE